MSGLRVLPAEDDVLLREGLARLLERSGYDAVGQAADGTGYSRWPARPRLSW
jgi:DNA-binding NarL/FixJ family response regulator